MSWLTVAALATMLFGFGTIPCIPVCIALVSGDIFYEQPHPDGSLRKWGWPNKVAAFVLLALNVLPILTILFRR
ncbi:MAG: hypothetical protein R3E58_01320 [Phycisphaerae bacterium]|nr:hypothetical protein [Phycisphaerales bacterium]